MKKYRMRRLGAVSAGKINHKRSVVDGERFDSVAEKNRYVELRLMERAGVISELKCHPRWEIIPAQKTERGTMKSAHYTADFSYVRD